MAQELMAMMPDSLNALLKASGGFATDANGFLAIDHRHPIYLVIVSAFVIALASGTVAKEIEHGTILVLLACPIARWRLLSSKTGAIVVSLSTILIGALAGTWLGSIAANLSHEVSMPIFFRIQLNVLALGLAIGGYTVLISSASSDGGQATGWATGITVAMFFVDYLATLWSPAAPLGPLTVFHYFDPLAIARSQSVPWKDTLVLIGIGLVGFSSALVVFQRRDITN